MYVCKSEALAFYFAKIKLWQNSNRRYHASDHYVIREDSVAEVDVQKMSLGIAQVLFIYQILSK